MMMMMEKKLTKMKPVNLVVDKEVTNILIQQKAAYIVIDDY